MTTEEFIAAEIKDENQRKLAKLYLPAISRYATAEGWDVVRKWLYTFTDTTWQITINSKMTELERRTDDARRLEVIKQMGSNNAKRIKQERELLQRIVTSLFTTLLGKL